MQDMAKMLHSLSDIVTLLLTADDEIMFESKTLEGMALVGGSVSVDRVQIWQNKIINGEFSFSLEYEWCSELGKQKEHVPIGLNFPYSSKPDWEDMFLRGEIINAPFSQIPEEDQEFLRIYEIKSLVILPLFLRDAFWGFFSVDDCSVERVFSDEEISILRTSGLLIANALLHKEKTISIKETTRKLKAAQHTVSAMFEASPHINVLFGPDFQVLDCNPAALKFLNFETKEDLKEGFIPRLVGSIPKFQPDGRPSIPLSERLITAAKEGICRFETEIHAGPMVRILKVEFKKIPYKDSFAIVGYVFDITDLHEREMELKRRDIQLREAVEEAKAANQAKSAFLSNMSHEIRTPMNAILGITEIQLMDESLPSGVKEAFGKIYSSGDLLLGIINDILDLSRIEMGKLELEVVNYEIASLVNDTTHINMMHIGSKPIDLILDVDENTPRILLGDELRVKQILNNLLSNAFKYTDEGTVTLTVHAEASGDNEDEMIVVFRVKDTGQGMSEEQVSKLFEEYARFNTDANRTTEGTGLGMSITRNLVELMRGEISVESEKGKGSEFTVRLPQGKVGPEVIGKDLAENLQHFRVNSKTRMKRVQIAREPMPYGSVLIVDDVETNIYVAKGLLTPYDLKVDAAESGHTAIKKIKQGNVYDIVFMDHMMPGMDGIEATRIIREMGYKGSIVALTANAVVGQSDMFLKNGFDDFISKPIDVRQLNVVLKKLVRDKYPAEVVKAAQQSAGKSKSGASAESSDGLRREPEVVKIFLRDANKTIGVLETICEKSGVPGEVPSEVPSEEDISLYVVNIHGIKSALANIGESELSEFALKLEKAGRANDTGLILSETPVFINSLKLLVKELIPEASEGAANEDEDPAYLIERLRDIKASCEAMDKKTVKKIMADIRGKKWSLDTGMMLDQITEYLLHSDFDEIVSTIDKFTA